MAWSAKELRKMARQYALAAGIDPDIFERQIGAESNFQMGAVSSAGASGPAQIMPETAKGWGVDLYDNDPRDDLRAAARNMARYIDRYGGWENALRAYNAGPGAIEESRGYDETNAYVARILGGQNPRNPGKPGGPNRVGQPATSDAGENPFPTIASIYNTQEDDNPYAETMQRGWDLLSQIWEQKYGAGGPGTPNIPSLTKMGNAKLGRPGKGAIPKGLAEAFYDPVGGWDAGQSIGAIGGHGSHMHFGGSPKAIARIVRMAQRPKWGFQVREYSPIDPVDPVHTEGSHHYRHGGRGAADISGGDPGDYDDFFKRILRRAGWR